MKQQVLLVHARGRGRARTGGVHRDILAAVRFGIQRHQGFLVIARGAGVDPGEIAAPGRRGVAVATLGVQFGAVMRKARAVRVAQGGVGPTLGIQRRRIAAHAHHLAQNGVAAARIAGHGEHMAVIGRDQDQGFIHGHPAQRRGDRGGQFDGVIQGIEGIDRMVGVIDAAGFDDEQIALAARFEKIDGFARHGGEGRLRAARRLALRGIAHMRIAEQAEQRRPARRGQLRCVFYKDAGGVLRLPFGHQIAAIGASAAVGGGQKVAPTAPDRHLNAVAGLCAKTRIQMAFKSHKLRGDIDAARASRRLGHGAVVFPVAIDRAGIGRSRGGVGQPGGADNARGFAGEFGDLQQRQQLVAGLAATVTAGHIFVHAKHPHIGFHTGHDGAHGAGGIRGLGVHIVGFDQARNGEGLETQRIFLTAAAASLPGKNTRGGHRGDTHAVAEEQDNVLSLCAACAPGDPLPRTAIPGVVPLMRGDRGGAGHSGPLGYRRGLAGIARIDKRDVDATGQKQDAGDRVAMHGFVLKRSGGSENSE